MFGKPKLVVSVTKECCNEEDYSKTKVLKYINNLVDKNKLNTEFLLLKMKTTVS